MSFKIQQDFLNMIEEKFNFIRDIEILLDIDFPLLFSFNAIEKNTEKTYLAYVLEFKKKRRSYDKVLEMYIAETDSNTIVNLLEQEISLRKALSVQNTLHFTLDKILDATSFETQSKLPKETFYLTKVLPNRIDIDETKIVFQEKIRISELYNTEIINKDFISSELLNQPLRFLELEKLNLIDVYQSFITETFDTNPSHKISESEVSLKPIKEYKKFISDLILNNFKEKPFEIKGEKNGN